MINDKLVHNDESIKCNLRKYGDFDPEFSGILELRHAFVYAQVIREGCVSPDISNGSVV